MKKILTIAALLFAAAEYTFAQNISIRFGESKMLYDGRYFPALYGENVSPITPSVNVKFGWQDYSDSPFATICNHPEYGIGFNVDCLADAVAVNGPGMGNVYSLYGYYDQSLLKAGRFSLGYTGGFGIGCEFSKRYDPVANPWNIIISTMVNAHITGGIQAKYDISDHYFAGLGYYFNHYSNGATNYPNKGYNAFEVALTLGIKDFNGKQAAARAKALPVREARKNFNDGFKPHFQFDLQATGGVMAIETYYDYTEGQSGNLYRFKYAFQADALFKYNRKHATGLGFDFFVTPFADDIAKYRNLYNEAQAVKDGKDPDAVTKVSHQPVSYGVSVLHELCYRDLTCTVGVGRYIQDNDGLAPNKILYQLVNLKYHFPELADTYAGIVLKAHKFKAAESIQFCIGKRF